MTDGEAIEKLKNMRLFMQIEDEKNECKFTEDDYKANDMAIQALEKQMPKKPDFTEDKEFALCPCCNGKGLFNMQKYCDDCGQKIDWSDEE